VLAEISNKRRPSGEVYDEDPKCPVCACREHKPRLLAARDHSTPATAWPGVGEARRGLQPELRGAARRILLRLRAAAREPVPANAPHRRHPGNPLQAASGRGPSRAHIAPVRARPYPASTNPPALGIRPGCGRPRPSLPGTPISGTPLPSSRSLLASPRSAYGRKCPAD
jgi:hypothetical protein